MEERIVMKTANVELLLHSLRAHPTLTMTLHPVMIRHFGVGLHEMERLLRVEGRLFRREMMTWGGCNTLVSGEDEPVERFRFIPPNRGFGLVVEGEEK
jgi:hypothetical protein